MNHQSESLEQKIKNCRKVIIQNMEKTIQRKMVYLYFHSRNIEHYVKEIIVSTAKGVIYLEFSDAEKARKFYEDCNFKDKILRRPFNIYLNLQLHDFEMKNYSIKGINEENQREIFEIFRKIGIVKIQTNFYNPDAYKKDQGTISLIKNQQLSNAEFQSLSDQLKKKGINIFDRIPDKIPIYQNNIKNFPSNVSCIDVATKRSDNMKQKKILHDMINNISSIDPVINLVSQSVRQQLFKKLNQQLIPKIYQQIKEEMSLQFKSQILFLNKQIKQKDIQIKELKQKYQSNQSNYNNQNKKRKYVEKK